MKKAIQVLALLVVGVTAVSAQHQHTSNQVRGMNTPERIPDHVAYRLVLTSLAGDDNLNARDERIRFTGLSAADRIALTDELGKFRIERDALRNAYNQHQIETEGRDTASIQQYVVDVAALVERSRKRLAANLTAAGFSRLDKFVQGEKVHMTISESEAQ